MNTFLAETTAWRIKALGDDIATEGLGIARDVKGSPEIDVLRRRVATIKRMARAVEKFAAQLDAAFDEPTEQTLEKTHG